MAATIGAVVAFLAASDAAAQPATGPAARPATRPAAGTPQRVRAAAAPAVAPPRAKAKQPRTPAREPGARRAAAGRPWAKGVSAENQKRALHFFTRGNRFFEQTKYRKALLEYKRAVGFWKHPSIQYNMATCYIHLEQHVAAWKALSQALRFGRGPLSPERHTQALTYRKLLKGRIAFLHIRCAEPGAEVSLDGRLLFKSPGTTKQVVQPGGRMVVASKPGFITWKHQLALRGGSTQRVTIRMLSFSTAVKTSRRWPRYLPWTVLLGSVAVAATGIGLFVKGQSDADDFNRRLESECPDGCYQGSEPPNPDALPMPASLSALQDRATAEHWSGIALMAVGLLGTAAGITLVVLNQPRAISVKRRITTPDKPRVRFLPSLGPGRAGGTLSVRF